MNYYCLNREKLLKMRKINITIKVENKKLPNITKKCIRDKI